MYQKLGKFLLAVILLLTALPLFADEFVVRDIRVNGLHGISSATVINYLPIKAGQTWHDASSAEAIRNLYNSGLFEDVRLAREGNTLIVNVVQRTIISSIAVVGNETIPHEQLDKAMKELGLVNGRVFKRAALEEFRMGLVEEYHRIGKSRATVTPLIVQKDPQKVSITLEVNEGQANKIAEIHFHGNQIFSEFRLKRQLNISTWGLFTWITKKDQFSQEKLDSSLEALKNFYFEHGYLKFKVEKTDIKLSDNKKKLVVDIYIHEGSRYRIKAYQLKGKMVVPASEIRKKIKLKMRSWYTQSEVSEAVDTIGTIIGDQGYGFANVTTDPIFDDENHQVVLVFTIDPGAKLYVRKIKFTGNYRTSELVLRRAVKQDESSLLKASKIKESERQLRITNYFDNVEVKTVPVEGTNNQVDLDFVVNETPSTEAVAAVGYGTEGFIFDLSLNQANFLGTGRTVGVGFKRSEFLQNFRFNYYNPYYTADGIGRGFNFYYTKTDPKHLDLARYKTEQFGLDMNYYFPHDDNNKFLLGTGVSSLKISDVNPRNSSQIRDFVARYGESFQEVKINGGWIYNSLDKMPFPTKGLKQELTGSLFVPVNRHSLNYYKTNYNMHWYYPIYGDFVFNTSGDLAFGDTYGNTDDFPFYENYYAGGLIIPGTVRGFESYSLGPKDSRGDSLGGNFLADGSIGLIFPNLISRDKLRTQIFIDAGNVYNLDGTHFNGTKAGPVRFSAGLGVEWHSPIGPLMISLATPLNKQKGDETRIFDFTVSVPI